MNTVDYLSQIHNDDTRIDAKLEELERLRELVLKITPTLTKDSGGGSHRDDKFAENMAKIVDLEAEIDSAVDSFIDHKRCVIKVIEQVEDRKYFAVLHKRYIQYKTFEQIAYEMDYSPQWIWVLHRQALRCVDEILKKSSPLDCN